MAPFDETDSVGVGKSLQQLCLLFKALSAFRVISKRLERMNVSGTPPRFSVPLRIHLSLDEWFDIVYFRAVGVGAIFYTSVA